MRPMPNTDRWKLRMNRAGAPFGVQPFSVAWMRGAQSGELREVFDGICKDNAWGSDESVSGSGSTRRRTAAYVAALSPVLRQFEIKSFFDAPCGDLNWIGTLVRQESLTYRGGDIAPAVLDIARRKEPALDVGPFDICNDPFPAMDVWHCRDCLFHLPLDVALTALRNFARSPMRYALLTSNAGIWLKNIDIGPGGFRPLDLRRAPFHLPAAKARVKDFPWLQEFPRYVGLWTREQIAAAVL